MSREKLKKGSEKAENENLTYKDENSLSNA